MFAYLFILGLMFDVSSFGVESNIKIAKATPVTVGTSTSGAMTSKPFQRKTFFDTVNSNYWSFYYDGTQIVYKYSQDGAIWNLGGTIAVNNYDFSVWQDGSNIYLAYSLSVSGGDIGIISGTVTANAINFGGASIVLAGTASNAYVTKDISGYIWVSYRLGANVEVKKSTAINDITAWDGASILVTGGSSNSQAAIILPTTNGDVMAVGTRYASITSGYVFYASYDHVGGTWGATTIDTSILISATYQASPSISAVSDSNGNVHFIYRRNTLPAGTYYRNYTNGEWNTGILLSSTADTNLTLTLNPANGSLWMFWINSNAVKYKKGVSPYAAENWDALETSLYSTGTNTLTTAGYNTTSTRVFLQWTNGAANPYSVYFDNSIVAAVPCDYTSSQSGNWSDSATWVGGCVPGDGDNATITAGHTISVNSEQDIGTGVLTVNGTLNQSATLTAGDTTIAAGGTLNTNDEDLNVSSITIEGTLTAGTSIISVSGDWVNNGTFTPGNSTVNFNGPGTQDIFGETTFNILIIDSVVSRNIVFESNHTQAIGSSITLSGAVNNLLSLISSALGVPWIINISTNKTVGDYLSVSDSHVSGGTITTGDNSIEGNGNEGWIFGYTPPEPEIPTFDNLPGDNRPVNLIDNQIITTNPYIIRVLPEATSGIEKVEYFVDDILICTENTPGTDGVYSCSWDTFKYHSTIRIVARSNDGGTATLSRKVSVDPSLYVVSLPQTGKNK